MKKKNVTKGNKGFVQIPTTTIGKLLQHEKGADAIALYCFLQNKAFNEMKRYKIPNRPWATRNYCKKGLRWGTKRFDIANSILMKEGLKKSREVRNENGTLKGRYVVLPFMTHTESPHVRSVGEVHRKPSEPTAGFQTTSTDGKSINTDGKSREREPASKKSHLENDTNRTFLNVMKLKQKMAADVNLTYSEQEVDDTVLKLLETARNEGLKYNQSFVFGNKSELAKFLKKKIKFLLKDDENLDMAKESIEIAIESYYQKWIQDEYRGTSRSAFGLVKTLETQWKSLTG